MGVKNIFGGFFLVCTQLVMNHLDVDMLCVGEGENALVDLAEKLANGEDYTDVTIYGLD